MNTETTNKTIEKASGSQTYTLTISQVIDRVRAARSKTDFYVYMHVDLGKPPSVKNPLGRYNALIQVTRSALLEMLSHMSSRMRSTPDATLTVETVSLSLDTSAFYLY